MRDCPVHHCLRCARPFVRAPIAAKTLGLTTVLVTEATGTALAKLADVVIAIPRGCLGHVALHGATLVGLEALVLSLAAAKPEDALSSLDNLNHLRAVIDGRRKVRI